jgi:RNA polymerase sigma factor for flagellar operon FliA
MEDDVHSDLALKMSGSSESALWQRLRATGDAVAKSQLLDLHLPYARVVAAVYYSRRYHNEIEFDDYLQYASLGMLEALERYDPGRGVQFRTFAARRMHGSILNGLERLTEKQQQIAARQRLRHDRVRDLKAMAGVDAAAATPQEPEQLLRLVSEVGIGLALCWMLEGTGMVESEEARTEHFYRGVALRQLRQRLMHAVDHLPAQEKTVVRHHYLQELPFEQIAELLHLTRGRISQIHQQALLHLRATVREDADWEASF